MTSVCGMTRVERADLQDDPIFLQSRALRNEQGDAVGAKRRAIRRTRESSLARRQGIARRPETETVFTALRRAIDVWSAVTEDLTSRSRRANDVQPKSRAKCRALGNILALDEQLLGLQRIDGVIPHRHRGAGPLHRGCRLLESDGGRRLIDARLPQRTPGADSGDDGEHRKHDKPAATDNCEDLARGQPATAFLLSELGGCEARPVVGRGASVIGGHEHGLTSCGVFEW